MAEKSKEKAVLMLLLLLSPAGRSDASSDEPSSATGCFPSPLAVALGRQQEVNDYASNDSTPF